MHGTCLSECFKINYIEYKTTLCIFYNNFIGNRFLQHLSVTGNSFDLGSNESLAAMLMKNNTLTELNLSSCKLGGKDFNIYHLIT